MNISTKTQKDLKERAWSFMQLSKLKNWETICLIAVVFLAAWLRFSNLEALGYANHYYTAGIKSMLYSWHNFFYVTAEPGGSVSIDKPPVGLWLQAISAYFLGVSGFSVLLPELLAGVTSVICIYYLVRRSFGGIPGLLAALTMAITPVVVATDRNNTIDSTLILTLLLATWAFIKATETGKVRYLLVGAALVGVGFNIKMLQAFLPLPAFYAMYFLGSRETILQKTGKLLLASVLLVVISLAWVVVVDLTPADQRPYVGSSSDNSEINLVLVYNGVDRLIGMFGRLGRNGENGPGFGPGQNAGHGPGNFNPNGPQNSNGYTFLPSSFNGDPPSFPQGGPGNFLGPNGRPGNNMRQGFGGMPGGTGRSGAFRLVTPPLSKEVSWLLPFGIVSAFLLAARSRWKWPIGQEHYTLVLWGGWLLTCIVFFSIASFFHEYYLSMLAPPLAALVGIGVGQLWSWKETHIWPAVGVLCVAATGTAAFQIYTATSFVGNIWWLPEIIAVLIIGVGILIFSAMTRRQVFSFHIGFALIILGIMITPAIWSVLTNLSASQNQSLPSAYSGAAIGPVTQRGLQINQKLLDYLQVNTKDMTYLMAVPSAMQGADYILATGRPVLYMGGFMGQDDVVSAADLADLVDEGKLRYIYWGMGGMGPGGMKSDISAWVTSSCIQVEGFDTSTDNMGAPDGLPANQGDMPPNLNNDGFQNRGGPAGNMMRVELYDCKGQ